MNKERVISYLETSFLKEILKDKDVTDISFNGQNIYYLHNFLGRQKSEIELDFVKSSDFVRQIANLSERPFSLSEPILDVSFGRYRFNAIHHTIGTFHEEKTITFSLRMMSKELKISDETLGKELAELFQFAILNKMSIVIAGVSGSGKTELSKYLISKMPPNERLIIIDNINELSSGLEKIPVDLNYWIVGQEAILDLKGLIRNSLRSNPDWVIVAEARGKEMLEILNVAMSAHPTITTVHAFDSLSIIERMTNMVLMNDKSLNANDIVKDLRYHFRFFVFLKRDINEKGIVYRYISEVSISDGKSEPMTIYSSDGKNNHFHKIPSKSLVNFKIFPFLQTFQRVFILGEEDE